MAATYLAAIERRRGARGSGRRRKQMMEKNSTVIGGWIMKSEIQEDLELAKDEGWHGKKQGGCEKGTDQEIRGIREKEKEKKKKKRN